MEDLEIELLKWAEAPKEIEEEICEWLRKGRLLWIDFITSFAILLLGTITLRYGLANQSLLDIGFGINHLICGLLLAFNYYKDYRYLSGKGKDNC